MCRIEEFSNEISRDVLSKVTRRGASPAAVTAAAHNNPRVQNNFFPCLFLGLVSWTNSPPPARDIRPSAGKKNPVRFSQSAESKTYWAATVER